MPGQFVDTSAWVALFDPGDANHAVAVAHWLTLLQRRTRLYTTDYILDEAVTLASRRAGHRVAVRLGAALLDSEHLVFVEITMELRDQAWSLFQKYDDKVLSFTDCTSFSVMEHLGRFEVFTFEDDFAQVGFIRRP